MPGVDKVLDVLLGVYVVAGESTAFATCLLSVVRCFCLCYPFNKVKIQSLVLPTACFLFYVISRETAFIAVIWTCQSDAEFVKFELIRYYLTVISISCVIVLVIVSNVISIKKVISAQGSVDLIQESRRAAVTVLIVSVNFCIYTASFIVLFCLFWDTPSPEVGSQRDILEFFTYRVLIPMNSATNPLIYLVRKLAMRQFVMTGLLRLKAVIMSCRSERRDPVTGEHVALNNTEEVI